MNDLHSIDSGTCRHFKHFNAMNPKHKSSEAFELKQITGGYVGPVGVGNSYFVEYLLACNG